MKAVQALTSWVTQVPSSVRRVLLLVAAAALVFGVVAAGHTRYATAPTFWVFLIAAAVFLAESFPIHILYRREATSFSLFEVPVVVGIVFLPGWQLLLSVAVGVTGALILVRRQPLMKVLFNVPNLLLHTSVTTLIFDLIAPTSGFGPQAVLAAMCAGLVGSVLASSMIALVIRVAEGVLDPRKTVDMLLFSALVGVTNSCLAMIAIKLGEAETWAISLLAVPLFVATAAYRAFVRERHQREQLQFLLSATKSLTADLGRTDAIQVLLDETAAMFRASRVELVIFDNADGVETPVHCSVDESGTSIDELDATMVTTLRSIASELDATVHLPSTGGPDPLNAWLGRLGLREALVTPLRSDAVDIGLFVVADREGAAASFADADRELFTTLAFHVGTTLENDRLGQALAQLKKLEGELSHLAVTDMLTGLPNRLGLQNHLEKVIEQNSVDLLFLDLDDFKLVNDTLGHASGDELLVEVAGRIRDCLGPDDIAARLGGDEFAICVRDTDAGALVAQRIVDAIAKPMRLNGTTVRISCSIGIAATSAATEVAGMLRRADVAMYSAKGAGKNQVQIYTDQLGEALVERQVLRNEIQQAVAGGELRVHYQLIYDVDEFDGLPVGAEALVRWSTPDGIRSPGDFLPLAEESHLIVDIDRWVYTQMLADAASIATLDWISVNVSARHWQEEDTVDWLIDTTRAAGVSPSRVVLEVTETATMTDIEASIKKLNRLRDEGFGLALDDFGTGHSSIAYLHRLPITVLKIAQPFIADLHTTGDPTFVKAMIDLAHTLGLPVVSEGVETTEQLASLRSMGCDLAQGFLLSRPAALIDLTVTPALTG